MPGGGEPIVAKGKYERWLAPEGLALLEGWARDGLTDEEIARNCGCAASTLYDWKAKYPEFSEALKKGKEVADYEVENALFKRAVGYDFQEKRIEDSDKDGRKEVYITKHVPGDVTAQIFWLKNRRPDKWRERRDAAAAAAAQEQDIVIKGFLAAVKPSEEDMKTLYADE